MNKLLSSTRETLSSSIGCQKLGQPVPDSNFVVESNSGWPQQTQLKMPSSWLFQYSPVKARSVPFLRVTRYWSGVRIAFHSASVFVTRSSFECPVRASILSCVDCD